MIELLLAAALAQPCMIPKTHHRHKIVKPIATCVAPHVIMFTMPEPDIEPIPLPIVVTKFVTPLASVAPTYECDYPNYCDSIEWDYAAGGYFAGPGYVAAIGISAPTITGIEPREPGTPARPIYPVPPMGRAPEIDAGSGGSMVTLLIGLLAVIRSGNRTQSIGKIR